ncbi:MAG TPA: D-aminoacyl-tRNA deacylase [Gammaproteobacteria bacterium]|nr:D-aminoacyl-tRNA deacylase [Gammaproteobacteria bacterium]
MIALLQRVSEASVSVGGETVGTIGAGLAVFVCVERDDGEAQAARLVERLLGYRVFAGEGGKLNRSLAETGGGLLLVPQFTLAADTRKGTRPSLGRAALPEQGRALFERVLALARASHPLVASGVFGARMQVRLVNEGPVTFWLEARAGVSCEPGRGTE